MGGQSDNKGCVWMGALDLVGRALAELAGRRGVAVGGGGCGVLFLEGDKYC